MTGLPISGRHATAAAILFSASIFAGCSARPAAQAPAAEPAPGEAADGDAGGAMEGGFERPDGVSSEPAPDDEAREAEEKSKPTTTRRELSTVADALDAFEEDEIRLDRLLGDDRTTTALDTDACGSICEALASMRRSSDAICDLAGEDDERCASARDKLAGNRKRIEGRGCRCAG